MAFHTNTTAQQWASLPLAVHYGLLWTRRKIGKMGCNGGTSYIMVPTHLHKKDRLLLYLHHFSLLAANFLHTYIMHVWIAYRSEFPILYFSLSSQYILNSKLLNHIFVVFSFNCLSPKARQLHKKLWEKLQRWEHLHFLYFTNFSNRKPNLY